MVWMTPLPALVPGNTIEFAINHRGKSMNGAEVRRIRMRKGLTQVELGALLGYTTGQIVSIWETDRTRVPGHVAELLRLWGAGHEIKVPPLRHRRGPIRRPD